MKKLVKVPHAEKKLMTLETFLCRNGIRRSTYYELRAAGLAPLEISIGGAIYISACEERRWIDKMDEGVDR
jgi:hypothetical protein